MKLSPVKSYRPPGYPSRDLFIERPQLLERYSPSSWSGKALVAGALAAFILCGCSAGKQYDSALRNEQQQVRSSPAEPEKSAAPQESTRKPGSIKQTGRKIKKPSSISVAPLFIHGDGRGSAGCIVVAPPVFITEEEARQIICEEMHKENIIFNRTDVCIDGITILQESYGQTDRAPLVIDGICDNRNIAYEYVTARNYHALGGYESNLSVHCYNFRDVAENLREKLAEYGKLKAVVFYDPCNSEKRRLTTVAADKAEEEARIKRVKAKSRKQLKAQVRDFLEWMKARS